MRAIEFINEAQYDSAIAAMRNRYPESSEVIDWAKNLKKQDRVIWYLKTIEPLIQNNDNIKLSELQEQLIHYLGQEIPKIQQYQFDRAKSIDQTIGDLRNLEQEFQSKQNKTAPVKVQQGDYKLIEFNDGTAWWFVDRAYCSDEGRSGQHCGNVVGRQKKKQRILSYRTRDGHVILTFILEPNGSLGEMKAKGNLKPNERYHRAIVSLLMNQIVTGISGEGYLPDMNFSVFDLAPELQQYVYENKPKLVTDQVAVTPLELLKAIPEIKNNLQLQSITLKNYPSAKGLFQDDSLKNWAKTVASDPSLVIYAPVDLPGYQIKVLKALEEDPEQFLKLPRLIRNDYNFLLKAIKLDPLILGYITPNTRGYDKLCLAAVNQNGWSLDYVPPELQSEELCLAAVKQNSAALRAVTLELLTPEICLAAVKQDGWVLQNVPLELRSEKICLAAVMQAGAQALEYVPPELQPKIKKKLGMR